jgi:hypothetical protein
LRRKSILFAARARQLHARPPGVILPPSSVYHLFKMAPYHANRRARRFDSVVIPDDLYDYLTPSVRRSGRPVKHDLAGWRVTDDWPKRVPVTEHEVDVFEAWFGDILDELFGAP